MPSTLGGPAVNGPPASWLKLPGYPTVTHSRYYQPNNEYILGTAPGLPADWKNWSWYMPGNANKGASKNSHGSAVSNDVRFFEHIFRYTRQLWRSLPRVTPAALTATGHTPPQLRSPD